MKVSGFSTKASTTRIAASSWWVGLKPPEFYRQARVEADRMNGVTETREPDDPSDSTPQDAAV